MTRPYSNDLRERVVRAHLDGEPIRSVAARFGVSVSSVPKWVARYRATGSVAPGRVGGHRPWLLEPHRKRVHALVAATPHLTLDRLLHHAVVIQIEGNTATGCGATPTWSRGTCAPTHSPHRHRRPSDATGHLNHGGTTTKLARHQPPRLRRITSALLGKLTSLFAARTRYAGSRGGGARRACTPGRRRALCSHLAAKRCATNVQGVH